MRGELDSCLPTPHYSTYRGSAYVGDAKTLLSILPDKTIDLVITSPPFPLLRKKAYGNEDEAAYAEWFLPFAEQVKRVLKPAGSFILEMGNVWLKGLPVLSFYHYELVLRLCHEQDWYVAQEFVWFNPAKLPSPAEWVCRRRIRVKESVSHVWWLAKTQEPKARWDDDQATNLLKIAHTESNTQYLRVCRELSLQPHPARFPAALPTFFIQGLTDPGDVILDCFAGSNTTGYAAEQQGRHWLAFEQHQPYLAASSFRFLASNCISQASALYEHLCSNRLGNFRLNTHPLNFESSANS